MRWPVAGIRMTVGAAGRTREKVSAGAGLGGASFRDSVPAALPIAARQIDADARGNVRPVSELASKPMRAAAA
jgi:hypothetical protein